MAPSKKRAESFERAFAWCMLPHSDEEWRDANISLLALLEANQELFDEAMSRAVQWRQEALRRPFIMCKN